MKLTVYFNLLACFFAANCNNIINNGWYSTILGKSLHSSSNVATRASFAIAITLGHPNIYAHLNTQNDGCGTCLYAFAISAYTVVGTGTMCDGSTSKTSSRCVKTLFPAIVEINYCMTVLPNANRVNFYTSTALASSGTTCSVTQINSLIAVYPTWAAMIWSAGNSTSTNIYTPNLSTEFWNYVADLPCRACFGFLYRDILANLARMGNNCAADPFVASCISTFGSPYLTLFNSCTGISITPSSTQCNAGQITSLSAALQSFAPLVSAAKTAASDAAAGTVVATASTLAPLLTAISSFQCKPCFNAFTADVYGDSSVIGSSCSNLYTNMCATVLSASLSRFTACAGFALTQYPASTNTCDDMGSDTLSWLTKLVSIGIDDNSQHSNTIANLATAVTASSNIVLLQAHLLNQDACGLCMFAFTTAVVSLDTGNAISNVCNSPTSSGCVAAIVSPIVAANSCMKAISGASEKNIVDKSTLTTCSSSEFTAFSNVYRPWREMAVRAKAGDASFINFSAEFKTYKAALRCSSCFDTLMTALRGLTLHTGCATLPFSNNCIASTGVSTALVQFNICSGFALSTATTICPDVSIFPSPLISFVPMYTAAKAAGSGPLAGTVVADVLTDLYTVAAGKTCQSCFNAFTADVYGDSVAIGTSCDSPYSNTCATTLTSRLIRFTSCSGITLTPYPATPGTCNDIGLDVSSWFAQLAGIGVDDNAGHSDTIAHLATAVSVSPNPLLHAHLLNNDACGSCMFAFALAVHTMDTPVVSSVCTQASSDACLAALTTPILSANACIKAINAAEKNIVDNATLTTCTSTEFAIFENVYRPWREMVVRAKVGDASFINFSAEFRVYKTALRCGSCLDTLMTALSGLALHIDCATLPSSNNCLASTGVSTALVQFNICSGFTLKTATTICPDISILTGSLTSFASMYTAAIAADTDALAGTVVANALTATLQIVVTGKVCQSCFNAFTADVYGDKSQTSSNCASPYSSACTGNSYLSSSLSRFTACSGITLTTLPTPANNCQDMTSAWFSDLVACGVAAGSYSSTSLNTCVAARHTDGELYSLLEHLQASGSSGDSCASLAVVFANAVYAASVGTNCNTPTSIECLVVLSEAIDTFNTAANSLTLPIGVKDLVTAAVSVRCTEAEITILDSLYYPWQFLSDPQNVPTQYATAVSFLTCQTCFSALQSAVLGLTECASPKQYSPDCFSAATANIETFVLCNGGHYLSVMNPNPDPACEDIDPYWFEDLVGCGTMGTGYTFATLADCVADLSGDQTVSYALLSHFVSQTSVCATGLLNFANSVNSLSNVGTVCSLDNLHTSACLQLLSASIETFNALLNTSDDIVTGLESTRCTQTHLDTFDSTWRPWAFVGDQARLGYNDALSDLNCSSCLSDLFDTITTEIGSTYSACASPSQFTPECLSAANSALETFSVCSGGRLLNTDLPNNCVDIDSDWFGDLVACAIAAGQTDYSTNADLNTCVGSFASSLFLQSHLMANSGLGDSCADCAIAFTNAVRAQNSISTTCSNENLHTAACIQLLYDPIEDMNACMLGLTGAVEEKDIVTGFESTRCTTDEFDTLDALWHPWGFLASVSTHPVGYNHALTNIGCKVCFTDLAHSFVDSALDLCDYPNQYTEECLTAAADRIATFTVCNGGGVLSTVFTELGAVCPDIESLWFDDLVYCGMNFSSLGTRVNLDACLTALSTVSDPVQSASLAAHVDASVTDSCSKCAVAFASAVFAIKDDVVSCGWQSDVTAIRTSGCLSVLHDAINAFSQCANARGVANIDLVTGVSSTRCLSSDLSAFDDQWQPWGFLVTGASHPQNYDSAVALLNCAACLTAISTALAVQLPECALPAQFSLECIQTASDFLEAFAVCNGGYLLITDPPNNCADIDSIWYKNLAACAVSTVADYSTSADLSACVDALTDKSSTLPSHLIANSGVGDSCADCTIAFANAVRAQNAVSTTCTNDNLHTTECIQLLYQPIEDMNACMLALPGAVEENDIVTGVESTRCTNAEFAAFDILWQPWGFLASVSTHPVGYNHALDNLGCKTCFEELAQSFADTPIQGCTHPNEYAQNCIMAAAGLISTFSTCNGGGVLSMTPPNCPDVSPEWFDNLVFCGLLNSAITTNNDLVTCISNLLSVGATTETPARSVTLQTHVVADNLCSGCAVAFAGAVWSAQSPFVSCGYIANGWQTGDTRIRTSSCLRALYGAINAFNACANNHRISSIDVVTGQPSIRCLVSDIGAIDLEWKPWNVLATGAAHPQNYDTAVATLNCATCFTTLSTALAVQLPECADPAQSTSQCLEAASGPSEAFAVCNGGYELNTDPKQLRRYRFGLV